MEAEFGPSSLYVNADLAKSQFLNIDAGQFSLLAHITGNIRN